MKNRRPLFYLLLMLAQPAALALFFLLGSLLDSRLWARAAAQQGHPAPVFTLLLTGLGALVCTAVFAAALVGLILSLRRRAKEKRAAREARGGTD